jgi:peptide/nickel transport system permease protein
LILKEETLLLRRIVGRSLPSIVGFTIVLGFFLIALVVAIGRNSVLPYDPIKLDVGMPLSPPSWEHPFGTDRVGRDQLSRVLSAIPNALLVSVIVIGSAMLIGTLAGSFSAYYKGSLDEILMRLTDIFLALPGIILPIAVSVALGPGITNMMYALIITWWPAYCRMARGEALRVCEYGYVEAARIAGLSRVKVIFKHIIPNGFATMLVYATIDFGQVIMVYAGLSYLGLSVQPPIPDLGAMINEYQSYLVSGPWLPLFPSVVVAMIVIGFGLLGDRLRDVFESGQ